MKNKRIVRLAALAICLVMCFAATSCSFVSAAASKASGYIDFTLELIDAVKRGDLEDAERFLHPQAIVTVEDIERMLEEQKEDIDAFYSADASEWIGSGNSIESFNVKNNVEIAHIPIVARWYIEELDEYGLSVSVDLKPKHGIHSGYIAIDAKILNNEQGIGIYDLVIR